MGSLNFDKVFQNLGKKNDDDDQESIKAHNFAQKILS
jgi:hypothetical protein